jgi:hypothetical protein
MFTIIDNFLSLRHFSKLKEVIESSEFSWHYRKDITWPDNPNNSLYSFGFDHILIENYQVYNSNICNILTGFYCELLDVTECSKISKSRVDMVTYCPEKTQHTIHVDEYFPHIASIFYFTDSDAETILYDHQCFSFDQYLEYINFDELKIIQEIQPKENRLLFFDGSILHTGKSPSKYKNRIIINTDLVK